MAPISPPSSAKRPRPRPAPPTPDELPDELPLSDPNNPTRWRHRRRLAYTSMISMIVVTIVILSPLVPESRLTVVGELMTWFYFAMASIVGAYVGFATWAEKRDGNSDRDYYFGGGSR